MANSGKIGVTSENIFPIIKKFLYSDHDIFLRELVSNAIDATSKLKTIANKEKLSEDISSLKIKIDLDTENKTLTISDNGIGMTEDEVNKYINQIAFSGAEEFLKQHEGVENNIIGHFGLGFYSAFMVSKKVEIETLSYKNGAKAVHWECDGSPEYKISASNKKERGTSITLHIDDESVEFLSKERIGALLDKYCRFLPFPIIFGKKQEWKDGKMIDTDEENQINETSPLWVKTPNEANLEDYKSFHKNLYPNSDEPLFWIHLNVDYPFTLKGVLYFPKIKPNVELQKNKIKLYCNQVFVTDHIEDIVPEWLTLLEGVIDSPDIPLNVSRSYLQNDSNAQKIAKHISKKVSDKLAELFSNNRTEYEAKWESIGLFVQYGMLTDEKAYERLSPYMLFKDSDDKYFTLDEYKTLIEAEQKNIDGETIILYTSNKKEQFLHLKKAIDKGYNVIVLDGPLSIPLTNLLEEKLEKIHFSRVDSDTIDNLIKKEEEACNKILEEDKELLQQIFSIKSPKDNNKNFIIQVENLTSTSPVEMTQGEWVRRMKDMSRFQSGMSFYDSLPDSYNLVINYTSPCINKILNKVKQEGGDNLISIITTEKALINKQENIIKELEKLEKDVKNKDLETQKEETQEELNNIKQEKKKLLENLIQSFSEIDYIWDLGLLSKGLLEGERLSKFIEQSTSLL